MGSISVEQRYIRGRRCPICGGADGDPRGKERRCFGFLSEGGDWAHCSREEKAGGLSISASSSTFGHRLNGRCGCGESHGEELATITPFPSHDEIDKTYDYFDESGNLLYQVVRFKGKKFRQRRPDGDRWSYSLEGVRRVLYQMDDVIHADKDKTIYIVEGEKDVDSLRNLGLIATCNPMGAGKWRQVEQLAKNLLKDRRVIIIPDADDPGRRHAEEIFISLKETSDVLKIELPVKDVSEWISSGGTAEALEQICTSSDVYRSFEFSSIVDKIWNRKDDPFIPFRLADKEICSCRAPGIIVLIGGTGRGKSSLACNILHEHATTPGQWALYVSAEQQPDEIVARMIGMKKSYSWKEVLTGSVPVDEMRACLPPSARISDPSLFTVSSLREEAKKLAKIRPHHRGLIVVDYIQLLIDEDPKSDRRNQTENVMRSLSLLSQEINCVILGISQTSRDGSRKLRDGESLGAQTTDAGAESAAIERWASGTIAIGTISDPSDDDGTSFADINIGKIRMGRGDMVVPCKFDGRTGVWRIIGEAKSSTQVREERKQARDGLMTEALADRIEAFASNCNDPFSIRDIIDSIGGKAEAISVAVKSLLTTGVLVRVRGQKKGGHWPLKLKSSVQNINEIVVD